MRLSIGWVLIHIGLLSPALAQPECTGDSALTCIPMPPCRWNAIGKICSIRNPAIITPTPSGYNFDINEVDASALTTLAEKLSNESKLSLTAPNAADGSANGKFQAVITAVPPRKAEELCQQLGIEKDCLQRQ